MTRTHYCAIHNCRSRLFKGTICDAHWREVPGWLRREISSARAELKSFGVSNPSASPELCALYRRAIEEVNSKHVHPGRCTVATPSPTGA